MDKIYEVVDASNDEMYWPMGLYLSLQGAVNVLKKDTVLQNRLGSHCSDHIYFRVVVGF